MKNSPPIIEKVIWRQDLQAALEVGGETMRRYIKNNKIPPPDVAMSNRKMGWRKSTIEKIGLVVGA